MAPHTRYASMIFAAAFGLSLGACGSDSGSDDAGAESDNTSNCLTGCCSTTCSGDESSGEAEASTGDGDGDTSTSGDGDGDGDGDSTTGDGDGDGTAAPPACTSPVWQDADFDTVYEVGPGQTYATPDEVPWESLSAGTLVKIHGRTEPYRSKWVINATGTADDPVVVLGVPEGGVLPVISGDGATTRSELNFWNEDRAVIKIGASSVPNVDDAAFITVECLDIRDARETLSFTDSEGQTQNYRGNAAAITIEQGHDLTIRNCELHEAGNGLFTSSGSSDVLVAGNYVHDNGNPGSIFEHNSYTESVGITFEFNRYGGLCEGCGGNNLKDRSAGLVVRYNWIEDGNRQLDLVDTDHQELLDNPAYSSTFVYGNVLVEGDGEGNSQMIHYGGDSGDTVWYRGGTLHLFHNTIISTRSGNTTLARLSSAGESMQARNNVVYATAGGSSLAIVDENGDADLQGNWLPSGWVNSHGSASGTIVAMDNVEAATPDLNDIGAQDFGLASGASCIDAGQPLHAGAAGHPVEFEFLAPSSGQARVDAGAPDIGAYAQ